METERIAKLEAQVEAMKDDVAELKGDVKEIHSRITTGNREIVDKIDQLETRLENKMNASADAAKKQHAEIQADIKQDVKKVTDRVDVLERWRWMIVGGAIAAGYLVGHLDLFSKVFGK
jgi:archaellum component FlaC